MFMKFPVFALSVLALLQSAYSQTSTMLIFPGDPNAVENLQGEIKGTGADGTTFVVSGIVSGIKATATIVEAATYISENIDVSASGAEVQIVQACGLNSETAGLCTAVVKGAAGGQEIVTTAIASATITYAPVAIDVSPSSNGATALPLVKSAFAIAPLLGFIVALW